MEEKNEELRMMKLDIISEDELKVTTNTKDKERTEENKKTLLGNLNVEDLYSKHMKKRPQVLKLQLSLDMKYMSDDDLDVLKKYGKVEKGITREILVPADITLHALNYAILRAFGWQNSHLHQFRFPEKVFQKLTKGKNQVREDGYVEHDGLYTDWMKLCGIYFRFPCDNFEDLYWDDDYKEGQSIKTWFAKKYTGPYSYGGTWEHYHYANQIAQSVMEQNPVIREQLSFEECSRLKNAGKEAELNKERLKPIAKATVQDLQYDFEGRMDEILERIPLIELMIPDGIKEDENLMDKIAFLQKRQEDEENEIPVVPVTDEIIYAYDFGDGWEVSIKLTNCYYTKDRFDAEEESGLKDGVVCSLDDKKALTDKTAYDMNNQNVGKALAVKIATVAFKRRPVCLALDGMSLMDDVGGIHGYVDFLRTIHEAEPDERKELREWAKWMGWNGRMSKPETLL